jgi:hypothetical protein
MVMLHRTTTPNWCIRLRPTVKRTFGTVAAQIDNKNGPVRLTRPVMGGFKTRATSCAYQSASITVLIDCGARRRQASLCRAGAG